MATFEITIDDTKIQDLLQSDQGLSALLGPILNQVLDARDGGPPAGGAPRADRSPPGPTGTAPTRGSSPHGSARFAQEFLRWRCHVTGRARSRPTCLTGISGRDGRVRLKALVLALMQMVVQGVSTRRVKKITTKLCGREFTRSTVSRLCEGLDEQVASWAERPLDGQPYPFRAL